MKGILLFLLNLSLCFQMFIDKVGLKIKKYFVSIGKSSNFAPAFARKKAQVVELVDTLL